MDLEDEAWQADNPEGLFQMTADDFPEEKPCTSDEQKLLDAAELITKNHITDRTRTGHLRFVSIYFLPGMTFILIYKYFPPQGLFEH